MVHGNENRNTAYFQPLIVGLFCILLISLFFVTALMDVRRTQKTLLDLFENRGITIIETVEMMAREKFEGLKGLTNRVAFSFQDLESIEEGFRMQEAILSRLIELGRELDRKVGKGNLTKKDLEASAAEAGLQAIVVYDDHGEVILRSAPVSKKLSPRLKHLLAGASEIALDLHREKREEDSTYLVGVRRKNAKGMIVLVFDHEGLQYWTSRVVVQQAVEEIGWRKGVHYFMVFDSRGRLLAGAGDLSGLEASNETQPDVDRIRRNGGPPNHRIIKGSPELLEVYAPVHVNGQRIGIAKIGMEIEEARRLRERNRTRIFFSTGLLMLGAVFALILFYKIQGRHLRKMQEMKDRLVQADRLSSLGRLAAGVAHEIRNPLNAVSMAIQRIQREFKPSEPENREAFSHLVTVIREEIRRLDRIIEDFVGPARMRGTTFRLERLADLLDRVVRLAREEAGSRDIRIDCLWEDPDLMIYMDPARMHQAVLNLLKNSLESITGHGTITVSVHPGTAQHVVVRIEDTGVGIPADVIKHILDFEYTTKEKGLGLGLPITNEIIQAHGGEMRIESEPGKGTIVELILPSGEK